MSWTPVPHCGPQCEVNADTDLNQCIHSHFGKYGRIAMPCKLDDSKHGKSICDAGVAGQFTRRAGIRQPQQLTAWSTAGGRAHATAVHVVVDFY